MIVNAETVEIANPTRRRGWGFGYNTSPRDTFNPRTGATGYTFDPPAAPYYTGTLRQVTAAMESDKTLASLRSGGTMYTSAYFYNGRRVLNELPFVGFLEDLETQRAIVNRYGGKVRMPSVVLRLAPEEEGAK